MTFSKLLTSKEDLRPTMNVKEGFQRVSGNTLRRGVPCKGSNETRKPLADRCECEEGIGRLGSLWRTDQETVT